MRSALATVAQPSWADWGSELLPIAVAGGSDSDGTVRAGGAERPSGPGSAEVGIGGGSECVDERARQAKRAQWEEWMRENEAGLTAQVRMAAVSRWVEVVRESDEAVFAEWDRQLRESDRVLGGSESRAGGR
jgi:hypothetical protein